MGALEKSLSLENMTRNKGRNFAKRLETNVSRFIFQMIIDC